MSVKFTWNNFLTPQSEMHLITFRKTCLCVSVCDGGFWVSVHCPPSAMSLRVLPVGYLQVVQLPPHGPKIPARLTGDSKLAVGVSVSLIGCHCDRLAWCPLPLTL